MRALKKLELTELISEWLAKEPRRTINSLSKRIRVSEMTVRRVANGESKPGMETALPILTAVAPDLLSDYMREHFPENWQMIENAVENTPCENSAELEFHLRSAVATRIICLANNAAGVTLETIERSMGNEGRKKVEQLKDEHILKENGHGILRLNKAMHLSPRAKLDMIKNLMQAFDLSNLGSNFASMHAQSDSFSEAALSEIKAELASLAQKIFAMRNDPKYAGDIPVFWVSAVNALDR